MEFVDVFSANKENEEKNLMKKSNKTTKELSNVDATTEESPVVQNTEEITNVIENKSNNLDNLTLTTEETNTDLEVDPEDLMEATKMVDLTRGFVDMSNGKEGATPMEMLFGVKDNIEILTSPEELQQYKYDHQTKWENFLDFVGDGISKNVAAAPFEAAKMPGQMLTYLGMATTSFGGETLGKKMIELGNLWSNTYQNAIEHFGLVSENSQWGAAIGGVLGDVVTSFGVGAGLKIVPKFFNKQASKYIEKTALKAAVKEKMIVGRAEGIKNFGLRDTKLLKAAELVRKVTTNPISAGAASAIMAKDGLGYVDERIRKYQNDEGEIQWDKFVKEAGRETAAVTTYGLATSATEALFGLGPILKMFGGKGEVTINAIRNIVSDKKIAGYLSNHAIGSFILMNSVKEGATEVLQEIEQITTDWAYKLKENNDDGTFEYKAKSNQEICTRLLMAGVIGGVLGGAFSFSEAVENKKQFVNNVSKMLTETGNMDSELADKRAKELYKRYYSSVAPDFAANLVAQKSFTSNTGLQYEKLVKSIETTMENKIGDPRINTLDTALISKQIASVLPTLANNLGLDLSKWEEHLTFKRIISNRSTKPGEKLRDFEGVRILWDDKPITSYSVQKMQGNADADTRLTETEDYSREDYDTYQEYSKQDYEDATPEVKQQMDDLGVKEGYVNRLDGTLATPETAKVIEKVQNSIDSQIKALREKLPKDWENKRLGAFDFATASILLNPKLLNETTVSHEVGHLWFETMFSAWKNDLITDKLLHDNFTKLMLECRINPDQPSLTRRQSEFLADLFSAYLHDATIDGKITQRLKNKDFKKALDNISDEYKKSAISAFNKVNNAKISISPATKDFLTNVLGIKPQAINTPVVDSKGQPTLKGTTSKETPAVEDSVKISEEQDNIDKAVKEVNPKLANSKVLYDTLDTLSTYPEFSEDNVRGLDTEYVVKHNIDQINMAMNIVESDLDYARALIDGGQVYLSTQEPSLLLTPLEIVYEQKMLELGNIDEFWRVKQKRSFEATKNGQEIQANAIGKRDQFSIDTNIDKILFYRYDEAFLKIKRFVKGTKDAKKGVQEYIDSRASELAKTNKPLAELIEKVRKDVNLKKNDSILFQTLPTKEEVQVESAFRAATTLYPKNKATLQTYKDMIEKASVDSILSKIATDFNATGKAKEAIEKPNTYQVTYDFLVSKYNELFNIRLSKEELSALQNKIDEVKTKIEDISNLSVLEDGNKLIEQFKLMQELDIYTKEMTPSNSLAVASSVISKANLLASLNSPVTNIFSNTIFGVEEMLERRITNYATTGNLVIRGYIPKDVIDNYKAFSRKFFNETGLMISVMEGNDIRNLVKGDASYTHSQGEGKIRAIGRFAEKYIYKYGLSWYDNLSKHFAFVDSLDIQIKTYIDKNYPDLTRDQKVLKAKELFEDAININPKTKEGIEFRKNAQIEAHTATFTNDGILADYATGLRNLLNNAQPGLGDFLVPFAKTPANVAALGLEASGGILYSLFHIKEIAEDIRLGRMSDVSRRAIQFAVRNGLGVLLAAIIGSMLDDDSYIPPYQTCTQKDRDLVRNKNASYNSIRFGNTYVSIDYLGPLGAVLAGVLLAKKRKSVFGYAKGIALQMTNIPGIDVGSEIITTAEDMSENSERLREKADDVLSSVISRLLPMSAINSITQLFQDTEKEYRDHVVLKFLNNDKISYTTGGSIERTMLDKLNKFIFGSRVKVGKDNEVSRELDRLNSEGFGVSLRQVTKGNSKKLKGLTDEQKQALEVKFSAKFNKELKKLISSSTYKRLSDEEKQKRIKKLKTRVFKSVDIK